MKIEYPKSYFVDRLRRLEPRAAKLTDNDFDNIINDGFAEMSTLGMFYSDEEVVSMLPYYEGGETKLTLDIEEDVTFIYDYYLTSENEAFDDHLHGIRRMQHTNFKRIDNADENSMYLDNRYNGRIHINLEQTPDGTIVDNAVIKYFYTPTSNTDVFYMDQQTRLATESAMASALFEYFLDTEKAGRKRAAMTRQALAIVPINPEDLLDRPKSMFPQGY